MPFFEHISESKTLAAGDIVSGMGYISYEFGALKRIRIISMHGLNNTKTSFPVEIGYEAGPPNDITLAADTGKPKVGAVFKGPIEVLASGFFWRFYRAESGQSVSYQAAWEWVKD